MTTLIERLRALHGYAKYWSEYGEYDMVCIEEVADEIERLRKRWDEENTHLDIIGNQTAVIQRLQLELAACQKDAERYRWLRDNPHFQIEYTGMLTLDEHIDAAMNGGE